jgi:hypothetical protein
MPTEFDPQAPRMQLEARQVRSGDHMRHGDEQDFRYVERVVLDGVSGDVTVTFQGGAEFTFDRRATVEVARRTRWVEVEDRYRIVDVFPYLDREEEFSDLTLAEAAGKVEDLTGIGADIILSDFDEPDRTDWKWTDDETGREVSLVPEVEPEPDRGDPPVPEAGDMSTSDGLGA